MFQWNHERLSALQAYGGARWKNPDMQTDFMAQEAAKNVPGWKGLTDINDAGSISYAYEGYGNKGEMNRGSSRMRSVSAALALWKARKASSGGGGDYKTFGNWHKEGKTFGHTTTCENDKGAFVDGQWAPWWSHLPDSPMRNGYFSNATGGESAGDVSKDAAKGDSWLKKMWNGTGGARALPARSRCCRDCTRFTPSRPARRLSRCT